MPETAYHSRFYTYIFAACLVGIIVVWDNRGKMQKRARGRVLLVAPQQRKKEPVGGAAAFSFVHDDYFYVSCYRYSDPVEREKQYRQDRSRGYSEDQLLQLQRFDFSSARWSGVSPVCVDSDLEDFCGWRSRHYIHKHLCCSVLGDSAYIFGGYHPVDECPLHELNLKTMVWRKLEPKNKEEGPIANLRGAGMVGHGDETLCVFGGRGTHSRLRQPQPGATFRLLYGLDCATNELHLFNTHTGTWSSPETTGPRPPPCAGFSFTKVDLSRAVMFGGEQNCEVMNEIHILDMVNWHWSGAILPSSPADLWPKGRFQHSACVLFEPTSFSSLEGSSKLVSHTLSSDVGTFQLQHKPQLLVLSGQNFNRGEYYVCDEWILDVNSVTWKEVKATPHVTPRFSGAAGCHCRSPTEAEIVVFGGHSVFSFNHERKGNTTLFYLGVKTLYHSCVDYVAHRYELYNYQPLLQRLLPPHIQTDICRERDKRANYRVTQGSSTEFQFQYQFVDSSRKLTSLEREIKELIELTNEWYSCNYFKCLSEENYFS